MATTPAYERWFEDPELAEWILGLHVDKPRFPGRFLKSIAGAARMAKGEDYQALRPALLELKAKYEEFSAKMAVIS